MFERKIYKQRLNLDRNGQDYLITLKSKVL